MTEKSVKSSTPRRQTRTVVGLLAVALLAAGVLHAVLVDPLAPDPNGRPGLGASAPGGPPPPISSAGPDGHVAALEHDLVVRPMPQVAEQAASPQVMADEAVGTPFVLAKGTEHGPLIPGGFPPSPEGAIAQLAALDVVALHDLDPQSYASAYRSISLPGAPDPSATPLGAGVETAFRRISVDATDPTPISSRWQPAAALLKGSAEGGRFLVVCVLGELEAAAQNSAAAGVGDCQALRYGPPQAGALAEWRIAPGPPAAGAPDTWPGSDNAFAVGYRPLTGAIPTS